MATEKWIAGSGQGLTWGTLDSTALNSFTSGNAILSGTSITNGTALDMFADISMVLGSAAFIAPSFTGIFLYPLNDDGTTYGDGRFTSQASAATNPVPQQYFVGAISFPPTTAAQQGQLNRIVLPPGTFKFCYWNQGGVNWASSGNTIKYRTYNRQVS